MSNINSASYFVVRGPGPSEWAINLCIGNDTKGRTFIGRIAGRGLAQRLTRILNGLEAA